MNVSAILYEPTYGSERRQLTVFVGNGRSIMGINRNENGWYCVNTRPNLRRYHETAEDAARDAAMHCYQKTTSVTLEVRS